MRLALIGGTGVQVSSILQNSHSVRVKTPYGSVEVQQGELDGQEVVFLMRHGNGHSVPPHRINYRAGIWALHSLGVDGIIATSAVGSLRSELQPGELLLIDSFLDFTSGRASTFYDGQNNQVIHTDMTYPYCQGIRNLLSSIAVNQGIKVHDGGCYVCTNGPRYETAAEIRAYAMLGGDVVGMTGVPEVVLARELGLCYASVALVTNLGAGLGSSKLAHEDVVKVMRSGGNRIISLLIGAVQQAASFTCTTC